MHAMICGFYKAKNPTAEALALTDKIRNSPDALYLSKMNNEPVSGFYKNEHYTTLDVTANVIGLKQKLPVYGICGQEDGLFDLAKLDLLQFTLGVEHFRLLEGASMFLSISRRLLSRR
jgi:proline iminopeptidase